MPVLGNNVMGPFTTGLPFDWLHGHFDTALFGAWASVIPVPFRITGGFTYMNSLGGGQNLQLGLYDASNPSSFLWPLLDTSSIIVLGIGMVQWFPLPWLSAVFPAGTYALGTLSWAGAAVARQFYETKVGGLAAITPVVAGVWPDPLGPNTVPGSWNFSLYVNWVAAGPAPGLDTFVADCDCNREYYK